MPHFHYQVAIPQPASHLLDVQLTVTDWREASLDLKMPVWSVGSYLIREYARHVVTFSANTAFEKVAKNHWRLSALPANEPIIVCYQVYANELTVRTNHVDQTHAFFNGSATFGFVAGWLDHPYHITIVPPDPQWRTATALTEIAPHSFLAHSFHELADTPFEVGIHRSYEFTVWQKPHRLVVWGEGNFNSEQAIPDIIKIVQTVAEFWGELPYSSYLFILHLSAGSDGGLEHRNSCALIFDRWGFRSDKYLKFLNLVCHEFFHVWNVKRLRPAGLFPIDYERENYTHSLWFCEGVTSYYDQLLTHRAGLCDRSQYLQQVSDSITRLQNTIGRKYQSLWESSFDAWIKLYRPDANSANSQVSYYLKGELVAMLLDLQIRIASDYQRSLDQVLGKLWQKFGQPETTYTDEQLLSEIAAIAQVNLSDFWRKYLFGTAELEYEKFLEPFGLTIQQQTTSQTPYTGMTWCSQNGSLVVKSVDLYSPAQLAGIDVGDEIVALEGYRVSGENFVDRLNTFAPGKSVYLTLFHQEQLRTVSLTLAKPQSDRYSVVAIPNPSSDQLQRLYSWLGGRLNPSDN
jgi:predicted metalloprotease with PDZ domain